jgi:hypothetical protein
MRVVILVLFIYVFPCALALVATPHFRVLRRRSTLCGQPTMRSETEQPHDSEVQLQNELHLIEAIEQRNVAQLGSFVDEKHQWESMSQEERDLLLRKDFVVKRLEELRKSRAI